MIYYLHAYYLHGLKNDKKRRLINEEKLSNWLLKSRI